MVDALLFAPERGESVAEREAILGNQRLAAGANSFVKENKVGGKNENC